MSKKQKAKAETESESSEVRDESSEVRESDDKPSTDDDLVAVISRRELDELLTLVQVAKTGAMSARNACFQGLQRPSRVLIDRAGTTIEDSGRQLSEALVRLTALKCRHRSEVARGLVDGS